MRAFAAIILAGLLLAACSGEAPQAVSAQDTPADAAEQPTRERAVQGDTVWVILNHIKADQREAFEEFVHETLWGQAGRLTPEEQRAFRQTRVLHPTGPSEDGTYTYVFILDPVIPGWDYSIEHMLTRMYGEDEAKERMQVLDEAFARDQDQLVLVQSEH